MTSPDTIARDIAARVAGGTREQLVANVLAAHRAVETYDTAYAAASEHPQSLFLPPLTVKEAAAALGVSGTMIRELVLQGKLAKVTGIGAAVRIPHAEIVRMLTQREIA